MDESFKRMLKSSVFLLLAVNTLINFAVHVQSQEFEPVAEAWICDENLQALSSADTRSPLRLGSNIQICIQPSAATRKRRIVMRSIDRFVFSKGDRGRNGVQEVIQDRQPVKAGETTLSCQPGAEVCTFRTRLMDEFFFPAKIDDTHDLPPSNTVIQGNGAVSMEYKTGIGERKLLRGNIEIQVFRRVQASSGPTAGTDDIQILDIEIAEQKRSKDGDFESNGGGESLGEIWIGLPTWAQALCCVGVVIALLCCCCCLGFFCWLVGVELSPSRKRRKSPTTMNASKNQSIADNSDRTMIFTIDEEGSAPPGFGQASRPGRTSRPLQPPMSSQNRYITVKKPQRQNSNTSDVSASEEESLPGSSRNSTPPSPSQSPLPMSDGSTHSTTRRPMQTKRVPNRNSTVGDSSLGPKDPLSLGDASRHHPRRPCTAPAPLPLSSSSCHSRIQRPIPNNRIPNRHSTGDASFVPKNPLGLDGNSYHHPNRPCNFTAPPIRSRNRHASLGPSTRGTTSTHQDPFRPSRVIGNPKNEFPRGSSHLNRQPLTSSSFHGGGNNSSSHGLPRRSLQTRGRMGRRNSLQPGAYPHPESNKPELTRSTYHAPTPTRLPLSSESSKESLLDPKKAAAIPTADTSIFDDDDDDVCSFASDSTTPTATTQNVEKGTETTRRPIERTTESSIKSKLESSPSSSIGSTSKVDAVPMIPVRFISSANLMEPSTPGKPNKKSKKVKTDTTSIKKKKEKKKNTTTVEDCSVSKSNQVEETWGDRLD